MIGDDERIYRNSIRLENPRAAQRLLARTINLLNDGKISEGKARTIGYLVNILIHSFETTDFQERLDRLEQEVQEKGAQRWES